MIDNPLYTAKALTWLSLNLKTYSRKLPMASLLGTVCADPGIRPDDAAGYVKAYTTLGGLILPYDATGKDEFSAMIATALAVKRNASNDADLIFIMGHENCRFIEAMAAVLLGAKDKFPIRGRFIDALLAETTLRKIVSEAVLAADTRGDDKALIVRVLTELMLLESLRNFREHVVDNDKNTIADYMAGKVKAAPRLNVMPALTLTTGEVIFFDPATNKFSYRNDVDTKSGQGGNSIEDILNSARNNFVRKIQEGDYSDLIITRDSDATTANPPRQLPPRRTGDNTSG